MHTFVTSCVNAVGEDIIEMTDMAVVKDISNGHFIKTIAPKLGIDKDVMEMLGYDTKTFFANDWAMSCHQSFYQGIPCYYVQHSRIEYIFVDQKDLDKVIHDYQDICLRHGDRSYLENELIDRLEANPSTEPAKLYKTLENFYKDHKELMNEERILMSSLILWAAPYRDTLALLDRKVVIPDMLDQKNNRYEDSPSP